jgi:hypothetical protein
MLGNDQLAAMAGAADPGALMQQMIAEASAADPRMAMVAQLLARQQPVEVEPANEDPVPEITALIDRLVQAEATIEAMKRDGRRLFHAHQTCRARLGELAAALGACGLCWGEETTGPSCRGRGRPGMVRPDIELRTRLLGPPRARPAPADSPNPNLC